MLEKTEQPGFRADALCELATVLTLAGKLGEAIDAIDEATELYRVKGDLVSLARMEKIRAIQ